MVVPHIPARLEYGFPEGGFASGVSVVDCPVANLEMPTASQRAHRGVILLCVKKGVS